MDSFSILLTAMEEGLALRWRAAPDLFEDGLSTAAQLLAKGALGLFAGLTAAADDPVPLNDYADRLFRGS